MIPSKTKLDYWCESVLEAGWLASLIIAPLFFNVFSSRVFEPDKISLVRSIALVMLLSWLIKVANSGVAWLPAYTSGASLPSDKQTESLSAWQWFREIPFLLPIILLIVAYIISTFFSVARFVSWWGSYQRLQGTYTFFSYVIIALLTAAHLRRPEQIRRLQHVIIVTSLPIAIYGVIQHYKLDPLPWGGDTSIRIAANAGNAIFLAAYLIMAFFFTLERIYSCFAYLLSQGNIDEPEPNHQDMPTAFAGGVYLFVLMVQMLAIFWTQSRGPLLGLLLGLYLFGLLLFSGLRPRGYRLWTISWVGLGLAGATFLILLNTTTMFSFVREIPSLARLSTMLDLESNNAQVRVLIWQGASNMIAPHPPLIYPDNSKDAINVIRPLVGYGPEAMWVAYNPFYPPKLAHHERRNASPDRSHNETWDALVITGIWGFLAYMALFISIFYWALRWLGLISNRRDNLLFGGLLLIFSLIFIIIFNSFDGSWRFFGVALPAGMMLGLGVYATIAIFIHPEFKPDVADIPRQLLIITLIATTAAHFAEIHFGIAIAATRTYFWVQSALLLVLGMRWVQPTMLAITQDESREIPDSVVDVDEPPSKESGPTQSKSKRRRRKGTKPSQGQNPTNKPSSSLPLVPLTVMTDLLVFLTFVFIYTTNSKGLENAFSILFGSITAGPSRSDVSNSPALLFLMIFTWIVGATLSMSVESLRQRHPPGLQWWLRGYGLHGLIVWGGWLIYGLIQGARLVPGAGGRALDSQLDHVAGHFAFFTWVVVVWILVTGTVYAWPWLRERRFPVASRTAISAVVGVLLAIFIFATINSVNIALVKADIIYKQGQQFDSQRNWISSIELYRRALQARKTEDHYMLFLGRSLLEQAKQAPLEGTMSLNANPTVDDVLALSPQQVNLMSRTELLRAAEVILLEAQRVNPLNTDHTANLARLYRTWADLIGDADVKQTMLDKSLEQYEMAVTLSPNAAHIWNEKGNAHLARGEQDEAETAYGYSLELDDRYSQTYLLLADFYERTRADCEKAIELLERGIETLGNNVQFHSYLGVAQARCDDLEGAIKSNQKVIELRPNDLGAMRNLAILNRDLGRTDEAISWTQKALEVTPPDNIAQVKQLRLLLIELHRSLNQMAPMIEQYELLHQLEPQNYQYPFALAQLLQQVGNIERARQFGQLALDLAPDAQRPSIQQLLASMETGS